MPTPLRDATAFAFTVSSSPIAAHVHFQVRSAWILRAVPQCFSRHPFQVPRHSFQLRHVSRSRSCKTLDWSEMSTRSCGKYTHRMVPLRNVVACSSSRIGLFPIVFCLKCTQFRVRSLDNVAWSESQDHPAIGEHASFSASISNNSLLITLTVLCNTSSSLSKCSAASCRSGLVSNVSCNSFPKLSIFDILLPQSQNRLHGRIH